MNSTLNYIMQKYGLAGRNGNPIEIPNVGRNDLALLFHELGFKVGVEVGVERGHYSKVLLRSNPDLKLFCVDPWKAYSGYRDHVSQERLDGFYEETKKRLTGMNVELVRKLSLEAVADFQDESIDFVYIDGNHSFLNTVNDLYFWSKKVRTGGVVSGHDYVHIPRKSPRDIHVVEAVDGHTSSNYIKPWFLLGTKEKVPGQIRDDSRSYMWVKMEY